jgi:hypothetical protein
MQILLKVPGCLWGSSFPSSLDWWVPPSIAGFRLCSLPTPPQQGPGPTYRVCNQSSHACMDGYNIGKWFLSSTLCCESNSSYSKSKELQMLIRNHFHCCNGVLFYRCAIYMFLSFCLFLFGAGFWPLGLAHARQVLYHWITSQLYYTCLNNNVM